MSEPGLTTDLSGLFALYALGVLDDDEARRVEDAVAKDPVLAAELAQLQAIAETMVAPAPPPAHIAARLTASIGAGRFAAQAARMASLFDVGVDRAHEILGLIERPASWKVPFPGYGLALVDFDGGPACKTADCGFIRLTPKTTFPPHTHRGEEAVLVISGQLRDVTTGRLYGPGDEIVQAGGSANHTVVCEGDADCIYAARAEGGIEIGGVRAIYPTKP